MPTDYLILTAVQSEADPFLQNFPQHTCQLTTHNLKIHQFEIAKKKISLCVCGIGTSFSAMVAGSLISELKPKTIFFSGTCGGIDSKLKIGDIVIASKAYEAEIQNLNSIAADTPFAAGLTHPSKQKIPRLIYNADADLISQAQKILASQKNIYFGPVASSNQFPSPTNLFEQLKQQQTLAIDMETSAIYQAGWLLKIPSLAVRCVSNTLDDKGNDHDIDSAQAEPAANTAALTLIKLLENLR